MSSTKIPRECSARLATERTKIARARRRLVIALRPAADSRKQSTTTHKPASTLTSIPSSWRTPVPKSRPSSNRRPREHQRSREPQRRVRHIEVRCLPAEAILPDLNPEQVREHRNHGNRPLKRLPQLYRGLPAPNHHSKYRGQLHQPTRRIAAGYVTELRRRTRHLRQMQPFMVLGRSRASVRWWLTKDVCWSGLRIWRQVEDTGRDGRFGALSAGRRSSFDKRAHPLSVC